MNRRGFLKALAAVASAPTIARAEWITGLAPSAGVTIGVDLAAEGADISYVAFVHPAMWREIYALYGRGRWEEAWRRYRIARLRGAEGDLGARDVLERWGDPPWVPAVNGELGTLNGVRYIESAVPISTSTNSQPAPQARSLTLDLVRKAIEGMHA